MAKDKKHHDQGTDEPAQAADDQAATPDDDNTPEDVATQEIPTDQAADLRNQLLRAQADFQNFKRRTEEERGRIVAVARADVILSLLPVFDNFDRAFQQVPKEVTKSDWYGGLQAIKSQFDSVLRDLGIERIESVGKPFDPNTHEAISHEPSSEYDKDIVSQEFAAGYRHGDEVIRHAKVNVSSGKAGDASTPSEDPESSNKNIDDK